MRPLTALAHRFGLRARAGARRDRGSLAVEAALITPLFVLLIFGTAEFGPLFLHSSAIKNAAVDAAREASSAGRAQDADWALMQSLRPSLNPIRNKFDYVIVYRAGSIDENPPAECIAEGARWSKRLGTEPTRDPNGGRPNDANGFPQPVGVFVPPAGAPADVTPLTFTWGRVPTAPVACNIYYLKDLVLAANRFGNVGPGNGTQMDYYWPGGNRVDYMTGPQDFLGVYIQMNNQSTSGFFHDHLIKHRAVMQIEARRSSES